MRPREFWALTAPSLIVMGGLLVVPLWLTVQWSFQEVTYGRPGTFVGFDNYVRALTDARFGRAALFTTGLTIVTTLLVLASAYVLAIAVDGLGRWRPVALGLLLIPYVMPQVVGATAFSWLFDTNFGGVATHVVHAITGQDVLWFTDTWPNRVLLVANIAWSMLPFAMLMILAALQTVPKDLSEAAAIDGVSRLQRHRYVIVPSIRGVLGFVGLILTMDVFRVFDNLIPLSPAAVDIGNESVMLYIYNLAFREGAPQLGLGSAAGVLSILAILVLLYPSVRGVLKEARGRE